MDTSDQAQAQNELFQLRLELLGAVQSLSARCLYQASKWVAEAANSLSIPGSDKSTASTFMIRDAAEKYQLQYPSLPVMSDQEVLAKTYFDCHEYDRCAHLLKDAKSPIGLFLKLYSLYISGEKKKEEEHEGILSPKDGTSQNRQIVRIVKELDEYFTNHEDEPYLLYLHGVALIHQKNEKGALDRLVRSVTLMPYNWSAWQEIYTCLENVERLQDLLPELPRHLMSRIFTVYANQEFFQHDEIDLEEIDEILTFMPNFNFLITQKAMIYYHGLDYDESEKEFEKVLLEDPHRLDDMDTYSNILYVMERRPKLAYLAQLASSTDKFRPETCCIIANYYSLRSEHEKAITYYQRALTLNRNCLSAWTLMGHEFVELKNTHAAIESYRHSIDVNKNDFRAWYGLGQAYEVLDMNYYSLYYYQRAAAIKPMDARMWQALGNCYEKLGKNEEAILTYRRALNLSELYDPTILLRLALIEEKNGNMERAAEYMQRCLIGPNTAAQPNGSGDENGDGDTSVVVPPTGGNSAAEDYDYEGIAIDEKNHARLWLARFEMSRENWQAANEYARGFQHGTPSEMEEARSIVKDTNSRLSEISAAAKSKRLMATEEDQSTPTGKGKTDVKGKRLEGHALFGGGGLASEQDSEINEASGLQFGGKMRGMRKSNRINQKYQGGYLWLG